MSGSPAAPDHVLVGRSEPEPELPGGARRGLATLLDQRQEAATGVAADGTTDGTTDVAALITTPLPVTRRPRAGQGSAR